MSVIKCLLCAFLLEGGASGYLSSKVIEGYPEGYLSDCPGSTKPAIITNKSLKYIGILIAGGDGSMRYRHSYNYYHAKDMIKDSYLDFKKKTVFFFSGFLDSPHLFVSSYVAEAYRRLGYNVLLMNAHRFTTLHYPVTARYMRPVGRHMAEMLTNLTSAGLDPGRLEFLGLSLGGQAMSFAAKHFQRLTGRNVSRLTALDPAGPCFRNLGPEERLDEADGDLVQVIDTNIDGFGMAAPVGHLNFYVNGGEYQPGDFYPIPCNILCSHIRSLPLWLSALASPDSFIGMKCDSVQQARTHQCYDREPRETNVLSNTKADRNNTGIFYLATDNDWPYYLGLKGLKKENEFWNKVNIEWNKDDVIRM